MKLNTPNLLYLGCVEISVLPALLQTADVCHLTGSRMGGGFTFCQQLIETKHWKTSFTLDFKILLLF